MLVFPLVSMSGSIAFLFSRLPTCMPTCLSSMSLLARRFVYVMCSLSVYMCLIVLVSAVFVCLSAWLLPYVVIITACGVAVCIRQANAPGGPAFLSSCRCTDTLVPMQAMSGQHMRRVFDDHVPGFCEIAAPGYSRRAMALCRCAG